ncbi:MAG: toxic anion resistance protein [Clostridiales bacterium]|nr:toxic anion resistance protein [Clostridiales bacterium]
MDKSKQLQVLSNEVTMDEFTPEETTRVNELVQSIDVTDTQSVIQFGVGAQTEIADFSDTVLEQVRSKDSGYVGEALSNLMVNVKDINVDSVASSKRGGLFNSLARRIRKFVARYDKLSVQIDKIIQELEEARDGLFRDIELLDQLYDKNYGYMKELDIFIAAGDIRIKELKDDMLPVMRKEAEEASDAVKAQALRDMESMVNRFEKKLHDLKLSRVVAIQSMPQIRLVQNNDQVLVERIQSSLLNAIPLWKNQIVIAITIFRQRSALEIQKQVTDTTNDLLKKNAEMLKTGTIETAKEAERGIVEIETLRQVNSDLIETITESLRIQQEGSIARKAVEVELKQLENELKQKLIEAKSE